MSEEFQVQQGNDRDYAINARVVDRGLSLEWGETDAEVVEGDYVCLLTYDGWRQLVQEYLWRYPEELSGLTWE